MLKRAHARNRRHDDKTISRSDIIITEHFIFFLTSGIQDFEETSSVIDSDLFSIPVFDCGVVRDDEIVFDVLDNEGGFSHTAFAKEDDFEFHVCGGFMGFSGVYGVRVRDGEFCRMRQISENEKSQNEWMMVKF